MASPLEPALRPGARRAIALLLALALLPAAELAARLRWGAPPEEGSWSDSLNYLDVETKRPYFRAVESGGGTVWKAARPRSRAEDFRDPKPPDVRRVFVVGESVAQRLRSRPLERRLKAAWGAVGVEIVNCGMGAYDSARAATVLEETLGHEPDLIVVLAGNNDGPVPPAVSPLVYRLNHLLRRSRLWRALQDRLRPRRAPAVDRAAILARLEKNLTAMARAARARGAPLVFCTLPVNERDWPPSGELPLGAPEFFDGWAALRAKRYAAAVEGFGAYAREKPADPMGRYWLARALEGAGRGERAKEEYAAALERDWPDRATPSRNAVIREVARREGAALADLEADLRRRVPGGVPGWESFTDGVHWRTPLDDRFAALIARAAAGPASAPSAPGAEPETEADLEGATLQALSDAVQTELEYDPPILSERVVARFERAFRLDGARLRALLADPEAAARRFAANPWTAFLAAEAPRHWAAAYCHAGEARARAGDEAEAAELFRKAAERGGSPLARLLLGKTLLALGRAEEGVRELKSIPADSREAPVAALYLAARPEK